MKALEKIIDVIFKAVEWVIAILVAEMTLLVFMQVISRYVLNSSLTWSEEIVNYSMIWISMLGACLLVRSNGHMAIDNFVKSMKGLLKVATTLVSVAIQIAFIVVMLKGILDFLPAASVQFSPVLRLNMGLVNSVFIVSGVLMLLGLADYWIIHKGKTAAFSEEDELLKQVRAENQNLTNGKEEV